MTLPSSTDRSPAGTRRRNTNPAPIIGLFVSLTATAMLGGVTAFGQLIVYPQDFNTLLISELNYHPPGTNGIDGEAFEFMELQNTGTATLDLSGLSFQGVTYTFPDPTTLGPGEFLVLVRDPLHFAERYPEAPWDGVYGGKLDNAGETIRLHHFDGTVLRSFSYNDQLPWPQLADGAGLSLQRVNTSPEAGRPANWTAATPTPGARLPTELVDTDGDHMPDVWEAAYGFSRSDPTDAAQDPDGDALSNAGEFLAGTNPADSTDCLRFTSVRFQQTRFREIVLSFNAVAHHSYSLFWQVGGNGCWTTAAQFEARATNRVETRRFVIYPGVAALYQLACPIQPPPVCEDDPD